MFSIIDDFVYPAYIDKTDYDMPRVREVTINRMTPNWRGLMKELSERTKYEYWNYKQKCWKPLDIKEWHSETKVV